MGELSLALKLGAPIEKIIYANPCKALKHLNFAKEQGIKMMTFDSESELLKIHKFYPEAELVIRLRVEEYGSTYSFKEKFGASIETSKELLRQAKDLELNVIGVSFHVGSGCKSQNAHYRAIKECRELFDFAKNELKYDFYFLDVGGGFSAVEKTSEGGLLFEKSAKLIKETLSECFPEVLNENRRLRVVAEPGTYFAQTVFLLAVNIITKKIYSNDVQINTTQKNLQKVDKIMYYVSEGVYSAFILALFEVIARPIAYFSDGKVKTIEDNFDCDYNTVIWGPTLDGTDCIIRECKIPELEVGDWLIFDNCGAYSMCLFTTFNSFPDIKIHWA